MSAERRVRADHCVGYPNHSRKPALQLSTRPATCKCAETAVESYLSARGGQITQEPPSPNYLTR
jgi:hypothetical protein